MDVTGYRSSGELSDITVVIDGEEFNLHKFPLFVRSYFFKSLTLDSSKSSRVELNNFPGGPRVFAIIADYCYNKEVKIDLENVVEVRCATEYLKMTVSGSGCSGLALLTENILFDLTYSAKSKKDYKSMLVLLKKSIQYADLAEKCSITRKIIDSFVENLAIYVKSNNLYDSIGLYDKSPSLFAPKKSLHDLSLNSEQINIINNLPLKWMNDLIRSSVRFSLNPSLLSYLIQNYIDSNTDLNPHYNNQNEIQQEKNRSRNSSTTSDSSNQSNKASNLIKMASDILKAEIKLESGANEQETNESKPQNLINIADAILTKENDDLKAFNLIKIANDILKVEDNLVELSQTDEINEEHVEEANDLNDKSSSDQSEADPVNLIQIAGDILSAEMKLEEALALTDTPESGEQGEQEASNLIRIAGDILTRDQEHKETSNLIKIAGDILTNEQQQEPNKPVNLINIADAVLNQASTPSNEASFKKAQLSNEDKLKMISNLASAVVELRFEPKFPISWLLVYLNALNDLNADLSLKSIFNRWTWNAISDLKSNPRELSAIAPSTMIKMIQDLSVYDGITNNEYEKLIDLTDSYINDLKDNNKLNCDLLLQLLSSIPKSKRQNYDSIATLVVEILEKDQKIDSEKQTKLLGLIDFEKINERTLKVCKNSPFIPAQNISEAALALCSKLRDELEDAKLTIKSYEIKSNLAKTAEKAVYSSNYASKYAKPTTVTTTTTSSSVTRNRNRSIEPKMNTNSRYNLQKSIEPTRLTQTTSYSSAFTNKNLSYPTASTASSSSNYLSPYGTSLAREARFSSPMPTGLSTVLNATYKSSNYNPSPSNTNSYLNSNAYYSNLDYYDSLADNYSYDCGECSQTYLDDEDYCCSTHNYPYYSRIY